MLAIAFQITTVPSSANVHFLDKQQYSQLYEEDRHLSVLAYDEVRRAAGTGNTARRSAALPSRSHIIFFYSKNLLSDSSQDAYCFPILVVT